MGPRTLRKLLRLFYPQAGRLRCPLCDGSSNNALPGPPLPDVSPRPDTPGVHLGRAHICTATTLPVNHNHPRIRPVLVLLTRGHCHTPASWTPRSPAVPT